MAVLEQWRGVKAIPEEEYFVSGHRTCQGCESALIMRYIAKAAGPRSVVMGSTGCMYVANTSYYTTPWVIPWMHTQLGAAGSAAVGAAAGLQAQMRKGKIKDEKINVIAFCGDGGGGDMGLSAISAALQHSEYNCLVILYDNESYANTDIQTSGMTPWGAITTFSPAGTVKHIMHTRWKKNVPGLLAAGHANTSRFIGTACASYGLDFMNKVRKALTLGGPAFLQTLDPCPKGWHYDPEKSHELGILAVECGIMPLWEVVDGQLSYNGPTKNIVSGKQKRRPVREWLEKQGRFSHFNNDDYAYFQKRVDEMWEKWILPGVVAFGMETADKSAVVK